MLRVKPILYRRFIMNKSELVEAMAKKADLSKKDAAAALDSCSYQ